MRTKLLTGFFLVLMAVLTLPSFSSAALITATIVGRESGQIKGDNTTKGQENTIVLLGEGFELSSPRDLATGHPTGRAQLKPLRITKYIDKASPILFNAAASNEDLTSVEIDFYKKDSIDGHLVKYFIVKLTHATISDISDDSAVTASNFGQTSDVQRETLTFTFQRVEITYVDGGITTILDWNAPI